jgi:hypothetical protein
MYCFFQINHVHFEHLENIVHHLVNQSMVSAELGAVAEKKALQVRVIFQHVAYLDVVLPN